MHEGHRKRIKERFINEGLDSFTDHQVLEMLLFYCIPRKDTNAIAHMLINRFGSLRKVFDADAKDLESSEGIGKEASIFLSFIGKLAKSYIKRAPIKGQKITNVADAGEYVINLFFGERNECFYLVSLDTQSRVLHTDLLFRGTTNEMHIYPRQIVEAALRHNAQHVILTHNHPGGNLQPSKSDINTTKEIIRALEPLGINVLDHFIVHESLCYSFVERRLITKRAIDNLIYITAEDSDINR